MGDTKAALRGTEGLEQWPIDDLVPYAGNVRDHSDEQVESLAASIRRFGFTVPVLVAEDGEIIAGHGRVLAAQVVGLVDVPVIVARGWSEEKVRAYRIADNRLAEMSTWNDDALRAEIQALIDADVETEGLGFSEGDLASLLNIEDGLEDGFEDVKTDATETTRVRIGPYSFLVRNDTVKAMLLDVRQDVGDEKAAIIEALKDKLGLT